MHITLAFITEVIFSLGFDMADLIFLHHNHNLCPNNESDVDRANHWGFFAWS